MNERVARENFRLQLSQAIIFVSGTLNTSNLSTIWLFCSKSMLWQKERSCRSIAPSHSGVLDTASTATAPRLTGGWTDLLGMKISITFLRREFENTFNRFEKPALYPNCGYIGLSGLRAVCG